MHIKLNQFLFFILFSVLNISSSFAGSKFSSSFSCTDSTKVCVSSGTRLIGGLKVHRDCWEWSYKKTCTIPSKDDCKSYEHCYEIGIKDCVLKDTYGNCVNQRKEFSCKRQLEDSIEKEIVRRKPTAEDAQKIVCEGVPCLDGNCVDKSYIQDSSLAEMASMLNMLSKIKGADSGSYQLFKGSSQHCSKKPSGYMNCCKIKGWGGGLGAKCSRDERDLSDRRSKNLCIYVGKSTSGKSPFHVNKHHFCCFSDMLNKVFQVEARKQLGIGFGSGGSPDCRGITLDEIQKLDFEKMDLSEFESDVARKMKVPSVSDISERTKETITKFKSTPMPDSGALMDKSKNPPINDKYLPKSLEEDYE
jgi:hypothetical protein